MKKIAELQRREARLRFRLAQIKGHPIELTIADRIAVSRELSEMQMIVERHLAGLSVDIRDDVAVELHETLPLFTHLRESYSVYYP